MQHTAQNILFVTNDGTVMNNGRSLNLKKGILGIVDKDAPSTKEGLLVTDTFQTTPATRTFELRLGTSEVPNNAIGRSDASWKSLPFRLKDVVEIKATAPSLKHEVDEVWIGYDGHDPSTAITLKQGETSAIDLTLTGDGFGALGYPNGEFNTRFYLTAPQEGEFTMQEIVETAVLGLKNLKLYGGIPLTDYVDIKPINSKNTALTGNEYTLYTLTLPVEGNSNNVALLKNAYPDLDIAFEGEINGKSRFTVAVEGDTPPADFNTNDVVIVELCGEYESSSIVNTGTYTWVAGETCNASSRTFTILLPDTECGGSRLTELQEAYPELTITAGTSAQCQTLYTTTVLTDFVCDGCSDAVRDLFTVEAPLPYDMVPWVMAKENFDETALMGIAFKGKEFITSGGEALRDTLPFIYSYVKISVSGSPLSRFINLEDRMQEQIADYYYKVTRISWGSRPEGLGMDYMQQEEETRVYYTLQKRFTDNLFANLMYGNESLLKPLAQYVMYTIHVRRVTMSQSFTQELVEHVRYNILAEVGRHKNVEALVNKLATATGLPTVQTYDGK